MPYKGKLKVAGDLVKDLDPDGELALRFQSGDYDAMGTVTLSADKFQPTKGQGAWIDPDLNVLSLRAKMKAGSKDDS